MRPNSDVKSPTDATYHGLFKAVVMSADDPAMRGRVRVCVHGLHGVAGRTTEIRFSDTGVVSLLLKDFAVDAMHLGFNEVMEARDFAETAVSTTMVDGFPWAEVMTSGGLSGAGVRVPYKLGDAVWVMFQNCNPTNPVVVGMLQTADEAIGVEAANADIDFPEDDGSSGSSGEIPALGHVYETARRRHIVRSRLGEYLELSEHPEQGWARLSAGTSGITLNGNTDSLSINASAVLRMTSRLALLSTLNCSVNARYSFIVQCLGDAVGDDAGRNAPLIGFYSDNELDVYARVAVMIGQYREREARIKKSSLDSGDLARGEFVTAEDAERSLPTVQANTVCVGSRHVRIGIACPELDSEWLHYAWLNGRADAKREKAQAPLKPTRSVSIGATRMLFIHVNPDADPGDGGEGSASGGGELKSVGVIWVGSKGSDSAPPISAAEIDALPAGSLVLCAAGELVLAASKVTITESGT